MSEASMSTEQETTRSRLLRYGAPVGYGVGAGMLAAAAHAGLTNNPANFRPDIYLPAGAATGLLYAKLREQRMQKESAFLPNQLAAPIQRFAGAVKPMVGQVTAPLQQAAQTATQAVKPLVNKAHYQANRASGWMMTNPVAQHFAKSPEDIEQIAQLFKFAGAPERPANAVEVNGKYYRPKVQTFMYDPRGRILASRSQAAGSGLRAFANYKFPGGGIEPNENVIEAAKKELLEEAGYEPGGEMFEFGKRTPVDWDPTFREQVAKKGRGAYDGQYEYYVAGPLGKRNTSHFGSEGDAMTGLELVRRDKLRKALERTASDPKNEYAYFDKQKLVALAELEKQLLARDIVKARRSAQSGR